MQNKSENKKDDGKNSSLKGLSFAYRISSELLAALIVSVILGLLIDKYFDSRPIGLISLIILGFFAGILNIYRLIRRIENHK
tara:strand:- start:1073 stop:1318 length:246 start_codon:yes stop_codon:yes gene_type:complete